MIYLDHVLRTVQDLEDAGDALLAMHGLATAPGGRHRGWGTANRIVPLGDQYLELLGVVDGPEAASNPFGQWVSVSALHGDRWGAWAVRTDDLETWAKGRGLEISEGSREQLDGTTLCWRMAGVAEAMTEPHSHSASNG
jgi:Glyoxalase-like domain